MLRSLSLPMQGRRAHHRARIDTRLARLFAELRDPRERATLHELLAVVRKRSNLLDPLTLPARGEPQLDALRNLLPFARSFVREPHEWPGCAGSVPEVLASLAEHLLCRYPVPRVMHKAWLGGSTDYERLRRQWVVDYGSGKRLRDCAIPLTFTRTMERHFLTSPHHLTIEAALRRAELLGLGADHDLARAVCATRMGRDLRRPKFWRSIAHFFVNNMEALRAEELGPIVDFLHTVRFVNTDVNTPAGVIVVSPPHPDFSIKGRSLASVRRLVERWHASLARKQQGTRSWAHSPQRTMVFALDADGDDDRRWEIVELTTSTDLFREGRALQHCVASYANDCVRGLSRIWSFRQRQGARVRSLATVEVRPEAGCIVQVRGMRNRSVPRSIRRCLVQWARREGLKLGVLAG